MAIDPFLILASQIDSPRAALPRGLPPKNPSVVVSLRCWVSPLLPVSVCLTLTLLSLSSSSLSPWKRARMPLHGCQRNELLAEFTGILEAHALPPPCSLISSWPPEAGLVCGINQHPHPSIFSQRMASDRSDRRCLSPSLTPTPARLGGEKVS